eukprot:5630556-Amphidinium_carterae.1
MESKHRDQRHVLSHQMARGCWRALRGRIGCCKCGSQGRTNVVDEMDHVMQARARILMCTVGPGCAPLKCCQPAMSAKSPSVAMEPLDSGGCNCCEHRHEVDDVCPVETFVVLEVDNEE